MKLFLLGVAASLALLGLACFFMPDLPPLTAAEYGRLLTASNGQPLRYALASDDKYRLPVEIDEISPHAVMAAIEYEDRYYFYHPGVNVFSLLRAAGSLFGGRRVGGSTLTMQVARLRYNLKTTTFSGKFRQIIYALALELRYSKQEILRAYFNLAPYGGNIEGIEAASRIYFHKPARDLTLQESRALAVIPQNPGQRKPAGGKKFDMARKLTASGSFSIQPLKIYTLGELPFEAPHLGDELLAKTSQTRIVSTIESDLQKMLERVVRNFIARGRGMGINNASAALVSLDDMKVKALIGSADYHSKEICGQIDGTRVRRSPGSTLKPFIYGLALDQGLIHPNSILADTPRSFGGYDPENFDHGFRGPVSASDALKTSRNLPAIKLAEQLQGNGLYGLLMDANVHLAKSAGYYGLALVLGGAEINLRELLGLYAALGNRGLWQSLKFSEDDVPLSPRQLLSPEAAWLVLEMLKRPEYSVSSHGRRLPLLFKTGTSNGLRDAWTAGIVGQYALVVWVGNFDNTSNPYFVGAQTALPLFEEIAAVLGSMRKLRAPDLETPRDLSITKVEMCAATGDIYKGQCAETLQGWFIPGVSPIRDTGVFQRIRIDKVSGLRACDGIGKDKDMVFQWQEIWPTDMAQIFRQAGVYKPGLPEWLPECRNNEDDFGRGPGIRLPKKNMVYHRRMDETNFRLPLQAATYGEDSTIHWFAGNRYLGSAKPGETIFWNAPAGKHLIIAKDESGRETKQSCQIVTIP